MDVLVKGQQKCFTSIRTWFASGCVADATAFALVEERLRLVGRGMFLCFQ